MGAAMYILGLKAKSVFICICICECLSNPCTPRLHLQELSTNLSPSMLSFGIRASISLNCTGGDCIYHSRAQFIAKYCARLHQLSVHYAVYQCKVLCNCALYQLSVHYAVYQCKVLYNTASNISALYCISVQNTVQALSAIACQCTEL